MSNPLNLILKPRTDVTRQNAFFRWATVTQTAPLRIRLDGDAEVLEGAPATLVAGLAVDDRVFTVVADRRPTILGKAQ